MENTTTIAAAALTMTAAEAMEFAAAVRAEADQFWDTETTVYTFGDGSQLAVSSHDVYLPGTENGMPINATPSAADYDAVEYDEDDWA